MDKKFKAWHKLHKKFFKILEIEYRYECYVLEDKHGLTFAANFKHIELLQYTGLKDKNGVEEFEFDWIRCEQRGKIIKMFQGYIFYNNDESCFCLAISGDEMNYERLYVFHNHEITGNIYENKELLK